jgi:hypothetical protein
MSRGANFRGRAVLISGVCEKSRLAESHAAAVSRLKLQPDSDARGVSLDATGLRPASGSKSRYCKMCLPAAEWEFIEFPNVSDFR